MAGLGTEPSLATSWAQQTGPDQPAAGPLLAVPAGSPGRVAMLHQTSRVSCSKTGTAASSRTYRPVSRLVRALTRSGAGWVRVPPRSYRRIPALTAATAATAAAAAKMTRMTASIMAAPLTGDPDSYG
jgi:hypothetical protein